MSTALVFDTETTGTNEPQIIEAAWIKVASPFDLVQIESFNKRYLPSKPIELGATATHHILIEDLVNCPPSSEFSLPLEIDYLIGHNVDYDWKVAGELPSNVSALWLFPEGSIRHLIATPNLRCFIFSRDQMPVKC